MLFFEGASDYRQSKPGFKNCRPFRAIGLGDPVEVCLGSGERILWHQATVVSQEELKFTLKLKYEDKTVTVEPTLIRPLPFCRPIRPEFVPQYLISGGQTCDPVNTV